jgi:hypothetical protein
MADAADWRRLADALRDLHRALIERARRDYESEHGESVGRGHFVQLLAADSSFAWLRPLSELMADLDMVRDVGAALMDELSSGLRPAVEHVIPPSRAAQTPAGIGERYWPYVQDDPHVAMAHAALRQALTAWPHMDSEDTAATLHERHRLAEKARHRKH